MTDHRTAGDPGPEDEIVTGNRDGVVSEAIDTAGPADDVDEVDLTDAQQAGYGSCEEALEEAVTSLERVTAERDEYLEIARRVQADFENFRKRVEAQRAEISERAAERLVADLLPVLDACEAALTHGDDGVGAIYSALEGILSKQGLARVAEVSVSFDPTVHEAVLSEPGDEAGPMVAEIMRSGYLWNGRVVRPAMVKVRG